MISFLLEKMRNCFFVLFFISIVGYENYIFAQPVGLLARGADVALQSDGNTVVAGYTTGYDSLNRILVARYTTGGILDTTFNSVGYVTTTIGTNSSAARVAIQPSDGKAVIVGSTSSSGERKLVLARYTTAGVLDTTFNSTGTVSVLVQQGSFGTDCAIQADGKIVVVGFSILNAQVNMIVGRYNTDGSLDTGFGSSGWVITSLGINSRAQAVAIQSDGKILVAGWGYFPERMVVVRHNTDGSLDSGFGSSGIVSTIVGSNSHANTVAIQSDGKIVVGGHAKISGEVEFVLARYNSTDGSLDTGFGTGGIATTNTGGRGVIKDLDFQSGGEIVVAGQSSDAVAVARYSTGGILDSTYANNGILYAQIGSASASSGIVMQSDDFSVVAGFIGAAVAVGRLSTGGTLDGTFGDYGLMRDPSGYEIEPGTAAFLWDQKDSGEDGGTLTAGGWVTRVLNQHAGLRGVVELSSNQITLQPGAYNVFIKAPANSVSNHQIRLYNVTDGVAQVYGTSEDAGVVTTWSTIDIILMLTEPKVFEVQHQSTAPKAGYGLGEAVGIAGSVEIYTQVRITKR